MENVLRIANHPIMYVGVAVLLLLVAWQASVFIIRAVKHAKKIGVPKEKLVKAAKSAAITSIVPSIAIIIAFITLAPVLGIPISWGRLSVIGSLAYELMAAQIGSNTVGAVIGTASFNEQALLIAVVSMTVGSFAALGINIFFFKSYKNRLNRALTKKEGSGWSKVFVASIIVALYSRFMAEPIVQGGASLVTLLVSALFTVLFTWIIKKTKLTKLNDFVTSVSMILGMIAAVLVSL